MAKLLGSVRRKMLDVGLPAALELERLRRDEREVVAILTDAGHKFLALAHVLRLRPRYAAYEV
jgi:hypothetical protein